MFDFFGTQQFFVNTLLVDVILVMSFYVVFQCGMLSLASIGFMAVGGYTSTILVMKHGWPVFPAIVAAMAMGGAVALVFGIPVLRLKGIYLALGSLALAQAVVIGIANFGFTNGARGFSGIPRLVTTDHLVWTIVGVGILLELIHRSHWGRALRAMRLDERTADGLGINALRYKTIAFAASGVLAALAGALEAHLTFVISPDQYSFSLLVIVLTYMIVGGSGYWVGPVLATIALGALREYSGFAGTSWENVLFGALLIVVMLVAPNGLSDRGLYRPLLRRLRRGRDAQTEAVVVGGGETPMPAEVGSR